MRMTSRSADAGPRQASALAVVVAMTMAQAASTMGTAVFPVIAPPLAAEMGLASATIGYLVSLAFGAATLIAPFTSHAVSHWGACRATQVGLVLCALAMALALTASAVVLALAAVMLGFAMTLMTPASGHLLFRFSPPDKRNFIFSIKQTGVPGGWVMMALAAPALTVTLGWRWAIALVLVIALGTALALQPVRARWDDDRAPDAAVRPGPAAGLRLVWRDPRLRWLAISSTFLTFVQLCLGTFLVTMLVEEAGYTLVAAGVMLSIVQAAGVAGRVLWGWVADRTRNTLGLLQKIAIAIAVCCASTAFLDPGWPFALVALFFFVFGLVAVGWNGLFLAEVAHNSPRGMVSVATSAAMVWNYGGILIGPALFATVYTIIGSYTLTYGWMTAIALIGLSMLTLSRVATRPRR
jgi:predicted MFS family arabinose efflux permease